MEKHTKYYSASPASYGGVYRDISERDSIEFNVSVFNEQGIRKNKLTRGDIVQKGVRFMVENGERLHFVVHNRSNEARFFFVETLCLCTHEVLHMVLQLLPHQRAFLGKMNSASIMTLRNISECDYNWQTIRSYPVKYAFATYCG